MVKIPCKHGLWKAFRGNFNDDISREMLQKKKQSFQIAFQRYVFFIIYSTVIAPSAVVSPFTTATSSTVTVVITSATSSASIVRS